MSDAPKTTPYEQAVQEQVVLRTSSQRRRRVIRRVVGFILMLMVMVGLSVHVRDQAAIRSCQQRMEFAAAEFRRLHEAARRNPLQFPLAAEDPTDTAKARELNRLREHVHYDVLYADRIASSRRVGVCCCSRPHNRLFQPAGRHVIIFDVDKRDYVVEWIDEPDFQRVAGELGLRVPTR